MAFDYTKYSYDELVAEVTRLISEQGEWKDAYQSSTGQVLIQMIAAMTDQLHYMLERRTQENFLPTARLKSSVGAISNLLGYRPRRAVSASGTLSLRLVDDAGITLNPIGNVSIPKYTTINYQGKVFANTTQIDVAPLDTPPYYIALKEGTVETLTYDPTDTTSTLYNSNYILIPDYEYIEENSLWIYTSTQEFFDVSVDHNGEPALESLAYATFTDTAYDIRITSDGLQIIFGDGFNGAKPVGTLNVKYLKSSATAVEISSTGLTFAFESPVITDDLLNQYKYELLNTTTINGALEPEDIETTKLRAPEYIRSGARAVTSQDYNFWTKRSGIGGIVDVNTYGEEETGISVINANNVYINYLTTDGGSLTDLELTALRTYLDTYKTITTHMVINPAEIIPLQLNVRVKRSKYLTASTSEIYSFIRSKLVEKFAHKEGDLGEYVYHSDIVDYLLGLQMTKDGVARDVVDYATVGLKALKALPVPYSTTGNLDATVTYAGAGEIFTISIDGTPYSYTSILGDTSNLIASTLANRINWDTNVNASVVNNVITVSLDSGTKVNYALYSEDLTNAYWTKYGTTITGNALAAPNGFITADKVVEDATTGLHGFGVDGLNAGNKLYAARLKAGEVTQVEMYFTNGTDGERSNTIFDLSTGLVISGPGTITALDDNYYECKIVDQTGTAVDGVRCMSYVNSRNHLGTAGNGFYAWGEQIEYDTTIGSYAATTTTAINTGASTNPYTISIAGSTGSNVISVPVSLPLSLLKNAALDNLIYPSSVEVIDSTGTVLATDDGLGNITGLGTVNYVTGAVNINLFSTDGTYYLRYSQNIDNNFLANQSQAFEYSLPKTSYTDVTELLSTITILN